jgi:hypothetical protein
MIRWLALLVAGVAAISITLGGCDSDEADANAPRSFFGIAPEEQLTDTDFARMAAGNVGRFRLVISWPAVETAPGLYDWSRYDGTMRQLAINRIEPVAVVLGTPRHYEDKVTTAPVRNQKALDAYAAFVRAAAERYGPRGTFWTRLALTDPAASPAPVKIWQIWNEQNSSVFWTPKPNIGDYAKLLRRSAGVLRAVDPNAEIMVGGMFATPQSRGAITSFEYLSKLYRKGGMKDAIDIVGIHPYGPTVADVERQLARTRKVMRKAGQGRDSTYVTEIGWGSDKRLRSQLTASPRKQAELLRRSFRMLIANRGRWNLRGAFWYTWRDPRNYGGACRWCLSAGLFDGDFDPKPAWRAFTRLTRGTP